MMKINITDEIYQPQFNPAIRLISVLLKQ